ncbi:lipopolysaccharide biosynthesis protein [Pseudoalteromonas neustonica]|uniref:lipopolysaccharide biosynthesis protein n=1 Tax=Pseudoalteromonas neustonica TaxID=1840331 RepID=UPI0007DAEB49|nr:oligosaccharide flippase family protein [Pseudoalteromonas neustonica]
MSQKKEVLRNLLSFGSIDVLGLLIPIITMPILTRALGPTQYGQLILFLMIMVFGHTIIDYGSQFIGVRALSKRRKSHKCVNAIYMRVQGLRIALSVVYYFFASLYCFVFDLGSLSIFIYTFGAVYLLGYALTPIWFYQGMGDTFPLLNVSLLVKMIHFLAIVFLVENSEDLIIPIMSMTIPLMIGGLFLTFFAKNRYNLDWPICRYIVRDIKNGKDVFIGILAPNLYNTLPTIVLGTVFPLAQFAQYAIASKLISIIFTVQNVIAKSLFSTMSVIKTNPVRKLLLLNFAISVIPILFILLFGEKIITMLLGQAYADVNKYFSILSLGALFLGLSNALSVGYFLPKGYDKLYRNISIRVSVVSGIITILTIYQLGLMGGAISLTFARFLFLLDYSVNYLKLKNKKMQYKASC